MRRLRLFLWGLVMVAAVATSGFAAPLRYPTPMPTRASLARLVDDSFPALISASTASSVRIARSKASPFSMRSRRAAVVLKSMESVLPLAFSSWGCSSSTAAFTPLDASTRISAAFAGVRPNTTSIATIAIVFSFGIIILILAAR